MKKIFEKKFKVLMLFVFEFYQKQNYRELNLLKNSYFFKLDLSKLQTKSNLLSKTTAIFENLSILFTTNPLSCTHYWFFY